MKNIQKIAPILVFPSLNSAGIGYLELSLIMKQYICVSHDSMGEENFYNKDVHVHLRISNLRKNMNPISSILGGVEPMSYNTFG